MDSCAFYTSSYWFLLWVVKIEAGAVVGDFHGAIAVGFEGVSMAFCSLWHDDGSWRTAS